MVRGDFGDASNALATVFRLQEKHYFPSVPERSSSATAALSDSDVTPQLDERTEALGGG